jgi:hypothetical protein
MNIRIGMNKQSGRLIEVALFLDKGMLAWTYSKLGEHRQRNNKLHILSCRVKKIRGAFWSLLPSDAVCLSRLELSCAINLFSNQASVLIAMAC